MEDTTQSKRIMNMTEEERLEAVKLLLEVFRIGDQLPKKLRSKKKKQEEQAETTQTSNKMI